MRLAIIGAGELGKLIAHHAISDSHFDVVGYYDDYIHEAEFNGRPVLGKCDSILNDYESGVFDKLFIGIGYAHMNARKAYFEMFKNKIPFANIIHSSSYVDPSCSLGEGVFILPGNVLDYEVIIGDNILVNTGGVIAHHSQVGSHTFIAPAVHIAGLVKIGEACFIGIGATIIDCISISDNSTVGAGSVVVKNTNRASVSYGVPAKFIRYK